MKETPRQTSPDLSCYKECDEPRNPLLDNPEISSLRDRILTTEFQTDVEYQQALLTLVHICDLEYQDKNAGHSDDTVILIGLVLADIHEQTSHYDYCLGELDLISRDYGALNDKTYSQWEEILWRMYDLPKDTKLSVKQCPVSAKILTQ